MTTKERWTVYPLLLLAIGLAVRAGTGSTDRAASKPGSSVAADTVVCRELAIVGEGGAIVVHAGRVKGGGGGRIEIRDATGADALALGTSAAARDGGIEFFDAQGTLVGRLGPTTDDPPRLEAPAETPAGEN